MLSLSTLITGYETVGDHTEFIVQISCNGVVWLISRRFSDFDQLHQRLIRRFGDLIEASLPEKQWFGRFDPHFLTKRQQKLQEYLDSILQVGGIFEDRSLTHFLEVERNIDLQGEFGRLSLGGSGAFSMGPNGSGRGGGAVGSSTSKILSENDRLNAIVENAAHAFIDISELPEPLEPEQALQRRHEILTATAASTTSAIIQEAFKITLLPYALPVPCSELNTKSSPKNVQQIVSILEEVDGLNTYEQDKEFLWRVFKDKWENKLNLAQQIDPSLELIAFVGTEGVISNVASSSSTTDTEKTVAAAVSSGNSSTGITN